MLILQADDFYITTYKNNNGFDLSLSFSLIAQSKAPLENYAANIEMISEYYYFGFRMFDFGLQ